MAGGKGTAAVWAGERVAAPRAREVTPTEVRPPLRYCDTSPSPGSACRIPEGEGAGRCRLGWWARGRSITGLYWGEECSLSASAELEAGRSAKLMADLGAEIPGGGEGLEAWGGERDEPERGGAVAAAGAGAIVPVGDGTIVPVGGGELEQVGGRSAPDTGGRGTTGCGLSPAAFRLKTPF
jgi:hypothetical protein